MCARTYQYTHSQVVCRQLGYPSIGAVAFRYSRFGQGEGPIVLDNVRCTGLEAYLTDCPNNGYFIHNCGHYEDAGVRCPGMTAVQLAVVVVRMSIELVACAPFYLIILSTV